MPKRSVIIISFGFLVIFLVAIAFIWRQPKFIQPGSVASTMDKKPNPELPQTEDVTNWLSYTNDKYGFSMKYPSTFAVSAHEGHSDFMNGFLSVDIGPADYIKQLSSSQTDGTEGLPIFLRVTAIAKDKTKKPSQKDFAQCDASLPNESASTIDGVTARVCQGYTLGQQPTIQISFTNKNGELFVVESNRYEGSDKATIDNLVSNLHLSK